MKIIIFICESICEKCLGTCLVYLQSIVGVYVATVAVKSFSSLRLTVMGFKKKTSSQEEYGSLHHKLLLYPEEHLPVALKRRNTTQQPLAVTLETMTT
jgi:hypothetical protein